MIYYFDSVRHFIDIYISCIDISGQKHFVSRRLRSAYRRSISVLFAAYNTRWLILKFAATRRTARPRDGYFRPFAMPFIYVPAQQPMPALFAAMVDMLEGLSPVRC